jgi:MraZ protein
MFRGRHEHVLDDKGRTSLPRDFRRELEEIGSTAPWITILSEYMAILPDALFLKLEASLLEMGPFSNMAEGIRRMLIGNAEPCPVDKQGRIMIPAHMRTWAGIQRDIVFSGVGNYIEVWDRTLYAANLQKTRENYAEWSEVIGARLRNPQS